MMRFSTLLKNPADWMAGDDDESFGGADQPCSTGAKYCGRAFSWLGQERRASQLSSERVREEVEAFRG